MNTHAVSTTKPLNSLSSETQLLGITSTTPETLSYVEQFLELSTLKISLSVLITNLTIE